MGWDIGLRKQDHPCQMSLPERARANAEKKLSAHENRIVNEGFFVYNRNTTLHMRVGQLILGVDNETIALVDCDQGARKLVINENSTIR